MHLSFGGHHSQKHITQWALFTHIYITFHRPHMYIICIHIPGIYDLAPDIRLTELLANFQKNISLLDGTGVEVKNTTKYKRARRK